jgi:hypothetical protein
MKVNSENILERVESLRKKMDDKRNMSIEAKQAAWHRVKEEAPDIAQLLVGLGQTFGEFSALQVTIGKETVIDIRN